MTATDHKALVAGVIAALADNPADAAPKLVLADAVEERGGDPDLVLGLRWCAAQGKWPARWRREWRFDPADAKHFRVGLEARIEPVPWRRLFYIFTPSRLGQSTGHHAHRCVTLVRRLGRALRELGVRP